MATAAEIALAADYIRRMRATDDPEEIARRVIEAVDLCRTDLEISAIADRFLARALPKPLFSEHDFDL